MSYFSIFEWKNLSPNRRQRGSEARRLRTHRRALDQCGAVGILADLRHECVHEKRDHEDQDTDHQ